MPISLYDAFVPSCRQIIGACQNLVSKAEAHCAATGMAKADLMATGLAPDMAPLPFQVTMVAQHSFGAIEGVRAGRFSPNPAPPAPDFGAFRAMLAAADEGLSQVTVEELEAFIGKPTIFAFGSTEMPFKAENFLLSFSQPNFYFHASTLYDILRHKGLKIGKRDFMGMPRMGL